MTSSLPDPAAVHGVSLPPSLAGVGGLKVRLASEESYIQAQQNLLSPTFVQNHVSLVKPVRTVNLMERISCRPSVFGSGLLVSSENENGIEVTQINAEVGGVFSNVFASVLNGAKVLEGVAVDPTEEQYTFVKNENRLSNDLVELNRLLGSYNVTEVPLRGGGTQICTEKRRDSRYPHTQRLFTICILYGANVDRVVRHRIRQGNRAAIRAAWKQEIKLVSLGFPGEWTPLERDELMRTGEVKGYSGEEIHSVHKYPSLLGQASNVRLVKDKIGVRSYS